MTIDAILPAGGRIRGAFARRAGTRIKALIRIGEKTVLQRVIEALRASGRIGRIVVIGPHEIVSDPGSAGADVVLDDGGSSGPANIYRGVDWLYRASGGRHADRVLIMTSDLPLVTPAAIGGFLDACPPDSDVCVPVIRGEEFRRRFPGAYKWTVRLRDGRWMIGCVFVVNPVVFEKNLALIGKVFSARRNPFAMAWLLGPWFVLPFVAGALTISDIEKRALEILGCSGCAVRGCSAELGFDIDKPAEYDYASSLIELSPQEPAD